MQRTESMDQFKQRNNEQDPMRRERMSIRQIFFDVDGPVVTFLTKTGELILLGLVYVLCCLPVVTFGAATTSLYNAVGKSIRHGRGYPVREFFRGMKQYFKRSTIAGLILLAWCVGLVLLNMKAVHVEQSLQSFAAKGFVILVILTLAIAVYLFPILSRFRISVGGAFSMAFIISGQHFIVTLIHIAVFAGLVYLYIFVIPILTLLFIPAFWMLGSNLLLERVLKDYMPEPTEEEKDRWYYENWK